MILHPIVYLFYHTKAEKSSYFISGRNDIYALYLFSCEIFVKKPYRENRHG